MKNFSHSINIDNNSNLIVSHTESDWAAMRNNSLVSIDNDGHFYTIGKIDKLNFIIDFAVDDKNNLVIPGLFEHYFLKDDVLTISYKEHELLTIKSIINKGRGYKNGDILNCSGGELSVRIFDNYKSATTFQVEETDGDGGVLKLKTLNKGIYIIPPEINNTLTGGNGSGLQILFGYTTLNNRTMIEREVISAQNQDSYTIIQISDRLPIGITSGKISMNKYLGYITSNYVGKTKRNAKYSILRDRTPHLGLPLLAKNSPKTEEFFNYTLLELDKKIKELEDRLTKAGL